MNDFVDGKGEKIFLGLLAEAMERGINSIKMSDEFRNYEEWDSLSVLSVMAMADEKYGATITRVVLEKCSTVHDLYEFVIANGKKE